MDNSKEICRLEIPATLDKESVVNRLASGRTGAQFREMISELADTALKTARPAGIYRLAHARVIDGSTVEIDGVTFKSKVLSKLLTGQEKVIPFIVTVGKELDELPVARSDMMKSFYLDTIKTLILVNAVSYLKEQVKKEFNIPRTALMNPGEIEDWRITEQRPLFSLFNNVEELIGVTLTEGGVMRPIKSRSGIVFPNESGFVTCQLCTQFRCPGRSARYEPEMVKYYLGEDTQAAGT